MSRSTIEWTDFTFNPWWGCIKVSDGCKNCYAETFDKRVGGAHWGPNSERRTMGEKYWGEPLKWNQAAEKAGERHRVFCASMADVFENNAQVVGERQRLFQLIRQTPHLDWLLLTKRPENIGWQLEGARSMTAKNADMGTACWLDDWLQGKPPANVWLGTSVENQEQADKRIPELLRVPAKVRFLSCEPLLGAVDLTDMWLQCYWDASIRDGMNGRLGSFVVASNPAELGINWVIAGGESGPNARPMHPDWARSLRDQCAAASVAFHFKQWGEWVPKSHANGMTSKTWGAMEADGSFAPFATCWNGHDDDGNGEAMMLKVGKKNAGRLLDGVEWNQFPEATP